MNHIEDFLQELEEHQKKREEQELQNKVKIEEPEQDNNNLSEPEKMKNSYKMILRKVEPSMEPSQTAQSLLCAGEPEETTA